VLDVLTAEQTLFSSRVSLVQRSTTRRSPNSPSPDIGRLTALDLNLPVQPYDFDKHYKAVRNKWIGFGPSGIGRPAGLARSGNCVTFAVVLAESNYGDLMSDAKGQQHEPSMEEILASIRRIIAEDGDTTARRRRRRPMRLLRPKRRR